MHDDVLGTPPVDKVGEDVAMARIQGLLFGETKRPSLERYALLEKLGEGAYGAVYTAWDPRLDRKVALKVLHGGANEALEQEARALAKLSHPNVVTVHDVGEADDSLFLAMEFVDGTPLSSLDVEALGWRKVVATYRQAAAGLAAAHDAGVVHRDFKPANALLGRDGRVRVLDFGLARAGVAGRGGGPMVETRAGGTPLYMAPEQHRGDPVDARSDQFGFCAALWEALHGTPPFAGTTMDALADAKTEPPRATASAAPATVTRILQRGLSPSPAERYPSMRALDTALARTLQRRTRALIGAAVTTTAVAIGIGAMSVERPCSGTDGPPPRWTPESQTQITAAFERTGLPHARTSAGTTTALLDDWSVAWGSSRKDACLAHDQGLQSDRRLDRRIACLEDQRERFDALLDVLMEADNGVVDKAVDAAAKLPSPGTCEGAELPNETHPIPEGSEAAVKRARRVLSRARAEFDAGHYARAGELAQPQLHACASAELAHRPTCIEATLIDAEAAGYDGRHDAAIEGLRTAAVEAQRARLPVAFARAAANLTWEVGEVDARFDEALMWSRLGRAALDGEHAPDVDQLLLNNEGSVLFTAGRFEESAAVHRKRLSALEPDSPLRMASLNNLANIDNRLGNVDRADRTYTLAIDIGMTFYGRSHPRVLIARQNRAGMRARAGRVAQAEQELEEVVEAHIASLGIDHPGRSAPLVNLSIAQLQLGKAADSLTSAREARRLVGKAYGPRSAQSVDTRLVEADALVALGRAEEAITLCEETLSVTEALFGPDHTNIAFVRRTLGFALLDAGRTSEAAAQLEQARAAFEAAKMTRELRVVDEVLAQSKASRSD